MTEIYLPIEMEDFEYKLDKFIECYQDLKNENRALNLRQEMLERDNQQLLEKVEEAKQRLETMINRLKAMENGE